MCAQTHIKWIILYNDMDLWKDPNLKQWPKKKTIKNHLQNWHAIKSLKLGLIDIFSN